MKRILSLPAVILLLLSPFILPAPATGAGASGRPNLIFLLTDDQRDNTLSAMDHPFVETPHLDGLLGRSVRFSNTYIATPVCAPSRVSYFTGLAERVHAIGFTSGYQLTEPQWARSYPALLRSAGYHTGFIGKFGVLYYTFKGKAADKFDFWRAHDGWTRFLPKNHEDHPDCIPYLDSDEDFITFIMGEAMTEFLDGVPEKKPFCLSVSFNVPHGSQTTSMFSDYDEWKRMTRPANENPQLRGSRYYDTLYRDLDIALPTDTGNDPYRFIPKRIMDQDKGRAKLYAYDYTRSTCLEHHIRYYQTISGLDHIVGNLMTELRRRGLAENTVIIYGSDHGLLMGEYGMGGKALLYDLAMKIPCFIHDPRLPGELQGRTRDHLVSSVDITRTILDYAGVPAPEFMDGASLRPLVEGEKIPWRDELFLESLFGMRDTPLQEGIRRGKWKYIRMFDGRRHIEEHVDFAGRTPEFEMLFDLEADPQEKNNLAAGQTTAEVRAVLADLRRRTAEHSIALNRRRSQYRRTVEVRHR